MDSHSAISIRPSRSPDPAYARLAVAASAGQWVRPAVARTVGILLLVPVVIVIVGVAGLVAGVVLDLMGRL